MQLALMHARHALLENEVPVGCVIVYYPIQVDIKMASAPSSCACRDHSNTATDPQSSAASSQSISTFITEYTSTSINSAPCPLPLVIGCAHNQVSRTKNASRHCELVALERALAWSSHQRICPSCILARCAMYVTCEPCIMCAAALFEHIPTFPCTCSKSAQQDSQSIENSSGLRLLVFGCYNDRFGGCTSVPPVPQLHPIPIEGVQVGSTALSEKGSLQCWGSDQPKCRIVGGILCEEAMSLLKEFYNRPNPNTDLAKKPSSE